MHLNPELLSLQAYEDDEQAATLSHPPVLLCYDPASQAVLRGPYRGMWLAAVERALFADARKAGLCPRLEHLTVRPWWRCFRPTPAVRVSVTPLPGGAP